jgi:V8-like Glu-specific endopeptidase
MLALSCLALAVAGNAQAPLTLISPTTIFPYSAQCKVYTLWADGSVTEGSGTLIGPWYVLTAGHVLHDFDDQRGRAQEIAVIPAVDSHAPVSQMPFDWTEAAAFQAHRQWIEGDGNDRGPDGKLNPNWREFHDIGVIILKRPLGNRASWMRLQDLLTQGEIPGQLSGYPGIDYPGDNMHLGWGQYSERGPFWFVDDFHRVWSNALLAVQGMSGSGIFHYVDGIPYVFAVLTAGRKADRQEYCYGVRLTPDKIAWLQSRMANDPSRSSRD